jgi:hypothetical protein
MLDSRLLSVGMNAASFGIVGSILKYPMTTSLDFDGQAKTTKLPSVSRFG